MAAQPYLDDCPICLIPISQLGLGVHKYHICGHVVHVQCVLGWRARSCPRCRSDWHIEDHVSMLDAINELGLPLPEYSDSDSDSEEGNSVTATAEEDGPNPGSPTAPLHILCTCCCRSSFADGQFSTDTDRRMHWMFDFIMADGVRIYEGWWTCLTCNRHVALVDVETVSLNFGSRPFCNDCSCHRSFLICYPRPPHEAPYYYWCCVRPDSDRFEVPFLKGCPLARAEFPNSDIDVGRFGDPTPRLSDDQIVIGTSSSRSGGFELAHYHQDAIEILSSSSMSGISDEQASDGVQEVVTVTHSDAHHGPDLDEAMGFLDSKDI